MWLDQAHRRKLPQANQKTNANMEIEEIDFEDFLDPSPKDNTPHLGQLPSEYRAAAEKIAPSKWYTLLELDPEGAGHNASLLKVAATCHRLGTSYDQTLAHLCELYDNTRSDYATAPKRAADRIWQVGGDISQIVEGGESFDDGQDGYLLRFTPMTRAEILSESPVPQPHKIDTQEIVCKLFASGDIIGVQKTAMEQGELVRVSELNDFLGENRVLLDEYKFLNPATFKKAAGVPNPLHPEQKITRRCNANVKRREWIVLEMDDPDESTQHRFNGFAMTAAQFAPLVMVVDTGGKSLHYWFDGSTTDKKTRDIFFNHATMHGADKRLAVKSQVARMPNVTSAADGRGGQKIIYYAPDQRTSWDILGFEEYLNRNKQLDFYYNAEGKDYLTRDESGQWITLNQDNIKLHLRQLGYRAKAIDGEDITPAEQVIYQTQKTKAVEFVMRSASGRDSGVYEKNGNRFIVKSSPTFISAKKGKFPVISQFLEGLLGHDPHQIYIFKSWLAAAVKDLRNGGQQTANWSPSQMLHLVGEANSGKTLLLKDIVNPCLSGRSNSADALFKRNASEFNAELFGAELLFLDDSPVLETAHQFRQTFGEQIKNLCVGEGGRYRTMRQDAVNIAPWWRLVRLMNTSASIIQTIPPLDKGLADKIILLHGETLDKSPIAERMGQMGWYDKLQSEMKAELPAFLYYLLEEYETPPSLRDGGGRYPCASYKNPYILKLISGNSAEGQIARFIRSNYATLAADEFGGDEVATTWQVSEHDLYDKLCNVKSRTLNIKRTSPTCGVFAEQLAAIAASEPTLVQPTECGQFWVVQDPQALVDQGIDGENEDNLHFY